MLHEIGQRHSGRFKACVELNETLACCPSINPFSNVRMIGLGYECDLHPNLAQGQHVDMMTNLHETCGKVV